jgi:hypothetical protein
MKAIGKIQINEVVNEATELTNPTLEVKNIYLECLFTDEVTGQQHSRMILLEADKENKLIKDAIKLNTLLNQFN